MSRAVVPRVAVVTNIPAPYRVPVYNRITASGKVDFTAFYSAQLEPDRRWDLLPFAHRHEVLDGRMLTTRGRFIHFNPRLWTALNRASPDVVITTGYNPTHLIAFAWAWWHGRAHIPQTDGTLESEQALTWAHRLVRRIVIGRSAAAVVASHGGWRLMRHYRVPAERIHFSPLCANTAVSWERPAGLERDVDFLFSARLIDAKRPDFAIQVAAGAARRLGRRVRLVMLGSGPLREPLQGIADLHREWVETVFAGHVDQADLPGWFLRSRVFLFPTLADVWGVVANEACMAGVPVIVTPFAGVADELVRDGRTGRVLPLELDRWVDAACEWLSTETLRQTIGLAAQQVVRPYSFENAAAGLVDAALQSLDLAKDHPSESGFVRRPRIVFVVRRLRHEWQGLFEQLRLDLDLRGIELLLLHAEPAHPPPAAADGTVIGPAWAEAIGTGTRVRPGVRAEAADLLVIEHDGWLHAQLWLKRGRAPRRWVGWIPSPEGGVGGSTGWFARWAAALARRRADGWIDAHSTGSALVQAVVAALVATGWTSDRAAASQGDATPDAIDMAPGHRDPGRTTSGALVQPAPSTADTQ